VIIADDIRKDDVPHRYTWIANMPRKGQIVVESQDATSMVLRHREDEQGGPRLLVKLLACEGEAKMELEEFVIETSNTPVTRMSITVDGVVRPDFVVLLYPYEAGPLPVVSRDKDGHTIRVGEQVTVLRFATLDDGRRNLTIEAVAAAVRTGEP